MQATETDRAAAAIDSVRELRPIIEAHRAESDKLRRQHDAVVLAMKERGAFRMMLPRELGGEELPPPVHLRCIEEIAAMDGSAGWNFAIGGTGGLFAGFLHPQTAREIFADPHACLCGVLAPSARAVAVDGGYRVTGRWAWASGIHGSTWALLGSLIFDGDAPRKTPDGAPPLRQMLIPCEKLEILDTWHTGGMRGTGSTECTVTDLFVPEEYSALCFFEPPQRQEPLYRLPVTFFGFGLAAVTLGIARAAIDALVELAGAKTPMLSPNTLREKTHVQYDVAQAQVMLASARDYMYSCLDEMWACAVAAETPPMELRARSRAAVVHAANTAAATVDTMYALAGGSALFERNAFERCHRDVHAALGHITLSRAMMEDAGRVMLGLPPASLLF